MSLSTDSVRMIQLPPGIKLVYHAEGAANIVYKILFPEENGVELVALRVLDTNQYNSAASQGTDQCSPKIAASEVKEYTPKLKHYHYVFHGKLLRLRKDQGHATSPLQTLYEFRKHIAPLFRAEELIHSTAVQIDDSLLLQLNIELNLLEQQERRPKIRAGLYLKQESHGTIMDDLRCVLDKDSSSGIIFELKPKWLLQSPDAPKSARRCRTCALRAFRAIKQDSVETGQRRASFCPLHLISGDEVSISQTLHNKMVQEDVLATNQKHIISYLANSSLLRRLRDLQSSLYSVGVLNADPNNINFLTVMTLRDCSLFLTVSLDGVVSAKLGDLDMKSPARIKHWAGTERQLIDGCWYEKSLSGIEHIPCALEERRNDM